jgi:hypothetical protein
LKNLITEKRTYKRITANLEGVLLNDNISYVAFIRNFSEHGLNTIVTPLKTSVNFILQEKIDLKLNIPSGKTINLHCRKRWSHDISLSRLTKNIGVEIIEPPIMYIEFINTLHKLGKND